VFVISLSDIPTALACSIDVDNQLRIVRSELREESRQSGV
jgi:hypothetical protein